MVMVMALDVDVGGVGLDDPLHAHVTIVAAATAHFRNRDRIQRVLSLQVCPAVIRARRIPAASAADA
jgi:hypothetical protein